MTKQGVERKIGKTIIKGNACVQRAYWRERGRTMKLDEVGVGR